MSAMILTNTMFRRRNNWVRVLSMTVECAKIYLLWGQDNNARYKDVRVEEIGTIQRNHIYFDTNE